MRTMACRVRNHRYRRRSRGDAGAAAAVRKRRATNGRRTAAPPTARIGTMSELMVHMIYPTSDAVFYITSRTPTTDAEWGSCRPRR